MTKKLVYLVEDDQHIQELIKYNLEINAMETRVFSDAESFLQAAPQRVPDLLLLDLMLPGMDGLELCKLIKKDTKLSKVPVIMITAKGEEFDKVLGLELGADDYITKPFGVRELLARVRVALRRSADEAEKTAKIICAGKLTLDLERHELYKEDQAIELTFKEFELLKLLMSNKGKVLSRDILLERIWGNDYLGETRTVDVHIRYLRQKIEEDDNNPVYIETVRGIGYRLSDKEDRE